MDAVVLFAHIAKIIIIAALTAALMKKFGQPMLFAYIVAGIILGPLVLGGVSVELIGNTYSVGIKEATSEILLLSELGAALLLFSIGIETSIRRLLQVGKPVLIGTLIQVLAVIIAAIVLTVPLNIFTLEQAIFVGTILSFSSTMIVVKILSDKNEINTLTGRLFVSILLLQDFLVIFFVPILANIANISDLEFMALVVGKSLALIITAILLNKTVFPRLFKIASEEQELFMLISIATAFFFIGLSEMLSIPIAIGAFIGGLSLSSLSYNKEIFAKVRAIRDFFLTIFFVSLGLELNFAFGGVSAEAMMAILLLIFIIKPAIFFLLALATGYGSKIGVKLGIMLAGVSEFGFELASIGTVTMAYETQIISAGLFSFLIAAIALSMILTPYLANSSSIVANYFYVKTRSLSKKFRQPFFTRKIDALETFPSKKSLKDHIVIIGGGTIGRGLAKALISTYNQVIVVDYDPEVVSMGQKNNLPYVLGSSETEELWNKVDLHDAKLIVITIPNHKEAKTLILTARQYNPKIAIFASAHYFTDALDYYENGTDFVAMTSIMGSNLFLQNISSFVETGKIQNMKNIRNEYFDYLKQQVKEEKEYKHRNFEI